MKKFTLALSALLMSAAAWAGVADPSVDGTYVLVPADEQTRTEGFFLTIKDGKLAYVDQMSENTVWQTATEEGEDFTITNYLSLNGSYLSVNNEGAVISTEKTGTFFSSEDFQAYTLANGNPWMSKNVVYLTNTGAAADAIGTNGWYFFATSTENPATKEDIENQIFFMEHPDAVVINVTEEDEPTYAGARSTGKYLTIDENGVVKHTNTYDRNALWSIVSAGEEEEGDDFGGIALAEGEGDGAGAVEEAPVELPENAKYIKNLGRNQYIYVNDGGIKASAEPVVVYQVESPELPGAYGFTLKADADPEKDKEFLNALNTSDGVALWNLNIGSSFLMIDYNPEYTAAQVDSVYTIKRAINLASVGLESYFNASALGAEMWKTGTALYDLEDCDSINGIPAARNACIQKAVDAALMTMEGGFTWKNNRSGMYVVYTDTLAADKNSFQLSNTIEFNGLWNIEVTQGNLGGGIVMGVDEPGVDVPVVDVPETPEEENTEVHFRIKNAESGLYVGAFVEADGYGVSNIRPTDDATKAGEFKLTAANNGTIAIQFVGHGDFCLNANNDNNGVVGYNGLTDAGAAVTFGFLPTWTTQDCYSRLNLLGETKTQEGMFGGSFEAQVSINAVELILPKGAVQTGRGQIVLTGSTDEGTDTLSIWSAEALKAITPVDSLVEVSEFNPDKMAFDTVAHECQIYILPLRSEITDPGYYSASIDEFMFSWKNNDATLYSPMFAQSVQIMAPTPEAGAVELVITPAEGKVTDVANITFDVPNLEDGLMTTNAEGLAITITRDGAEFQSYPMASFDQYMSYNFEDATTPDYTIPANIVDAGTYVMTVPAGFFTTNGDNSNEEVTVTWIIEAQDGINTISGVKVDSNVAFDLQGRRVANPAKGIFIINGKKVLVK